MVRTLTEKDMEDLDKKVFKLLKHEGVIAPHHGDTMGVEFKLINRQVYEADHYFPVKYMLEANTIEEELDILRDHVTNLSIASGRVDTTTRIIQSRYKKYRPLKLK